MRGGQEGGGEGFDEVDAEEGGGWMGIKELLEGGQGACGAGEGAVVFLRLGVWGGWRVDVVHVGFELAAELEAS